MLIQFCPPVLAVWPGSVCDGSAAGHDGHGWLPPQGQSPQGEGVVMEMLQERGLERDYGQMQEERLRCSSCRGRQGEAAGRLVLEEEGMAL